MQLLGHRDDGRRSSRRRRSIWRAASDSSDTRLPPARCATIPIWRGPLSPRGRKRSCRWGCGTARRFRSDLQGRRLRYIYCRSKYPTYPEDLRGLPARFDESRVLRLQRSSARHRGVPARGGARRPVHREALHPEPRVSGDPRSHVERHAAGIPSAHRHGPLAGAAGRRLVDAPQTSGSATCAG